MHSSRAAFLVGRFTSAIAPLLLATIVGCSGDRRASEAHQPHAEQRPDSVDPATARSVMAVADSFLAQYVETTAKRSPSVVQYWMGKCAQAEVSPSLWVGSYRVLSVGRRQDTLIVAAAVTSVAEEAGSLRVANRFVVRPRIRTDTLHWRVVQDTSGKFVVCGFALEDVDLGGFGRPDNVDFESGASPGSLRRQADSLRGAGGRTPTP